MPFSGKHDTLQWIGFLPGMSPQDLLMEMDTLHAIRRRYHGLCALNFEALLDIVLDKIVGDNPLQQGIFSKFAAYGLAVEEQGRKTLHAHIIIYILGWNELLARLNSTHDLVRKRAIKEIVEFVDSSLSTELNPGSTNDLLCFNCKQVILSVPDNKHLCYLRHKEGCKNFMDSFATCNLCGFQSSPNHIALQKVLSSIDFNNITESQMAAHVSYHHILANTLPSSCSLLQMMQLLW